MNKFETKTYLYIEQMVEVQLGNCCLGYISLFLMLCRLNEQHSLCLYYNAIYVLSETAGTINDFFYTCYSTKNNTCDNKLSLKYISIVNYSPLKLSGIYKVNQC